MYDEDTVIARFGFPPKLLPDYKGLRGDTSDNIIGIKGIGEKTATTLISKFGTIENLYKKVKSNKEEVKSTAGITDRILKLIEDGEEEALFSKTLATIRPDAPIKFVLPEKVWRESVDFEKATSLFKVLEFKSLMNRFDKIFGRQSVVVETKTPIVDVDPGDIRKIAIALWLLDSDKNNASLEDILDFAKTRDFS